MMCASASAHERSWKQTKNRLSNDAADPTTL